MNREDIDRLERLSKQIQNLTSGQVDLIERIANQFHKPYLFQHHPSSDIVDECVLQNFGDALRIHHCFSAEAFTKDKFEYALERISNFCGYSARRAPRGNPGFDIIINDQTFSLKTQADRTIRADLIDVSKFMELGRGQWGDDPADLVGLRDRFFLHMQNYDRILTLRRLAHEHNHWHYELVEIPKSLLLLAEYGRLEMMQTSKQYPKPGYCHVTDPQGYLLFQLYFDGGTERKLRIKQLVKSGCTVHAEWRFEIEDID